MSCTYWLSKNAQCGKASPLHRGEGASMSEELSDNYLRIVARSVGVTSLWLDDAVQEMRIKLWQAAKPEYAKLTARSAAIDFQRHVSHYNHRRKVAPAEFTFTALEELSYLDGVSELDRLTDPREVPIDDVIDMRDAIARLEPRDQRMIAGFLRGDSLVSTGLLEGIGESRACQLVRRARERLCA